MSVAVGLWEGRGEGVGVLVVGVLVVGGGINDVTQVNRQVRRSNNEAAATALTRAKELKINTEVVGVKSRLMCDI